ncbi:DUF4097 domain-containing protein [Ruminococcaceae bacterium OttesenSCG-928-A11]|nr:DUF4097 domain-containing protein [Ruminococcaceae bacterium OttesenSCG-928-A11]
MKGVKGLMIAVICVVLVVAAGLTGILVMGVMGMNPFGNFAAIGTPELVNRQVYTASELTAISADYKMDSITLLPSGGDEVVLEEYISDTDIRYQASISHSGGRLDIRSGERPNFVGIFGFRSKILLYVPASWGGDLALKSSSGGIHAEDDYAFGSLDARATSGSVRVAGVQAAGDITLTSSSGGVSANWLNAGGDVALESTSGSVRMGKVQAAAITAHSSSGGVSFEAAKAATIDASATSGSVRLGYLDGAFTLESSSGGVHVDGGSGHGTAKAGSGSVRLTLEAVTGDLELRSTSGGCSLNIPENTAFTIEASTSSGSVRLPDGGSVGYNQKGNQADGSYGKDPAIAIRMHATSGSVRLEWN